MAGLLTVLLYFLAFVLLAFALHPEDADSAGHSSGASIGERLVMEKDIFLLPPAAPPLCLLLNERVCISLSPYSEQQHEPPYSAGSKGWTQRISQGTLATSQEAGQMPYVCSPHSICFLIQNFIPGGVWTSKLSGWL